MKKFGLLIPVILAAILVTFWMANKSRSTAPHSPSKGSQREAPIQGTNAKASKESKKAAPFSQPQDSESSELKETRALLAQLSDVANQLEQEGEWIQKFRAKTSQPDSTMWKLRLLGHLHPEVMRLIEQYVRADEPLAARVFAVFSFVAPQSSESIEFIASLMRDPPTSVMANAACLCFDAWAANGIGGAWDSLFGTYSGMLGFPKPRLVDRDNSMWGERDAFVYLPDDRQEHQELYNSHSFKLDLTPIISSILTMLANADDEVWRNKWMNMAWQIMNHPKVTADDRGRLREITVKWYLEYDPGPGWDPKVNGYRYGNGWLAAMENLTKAWSPPELKVVGAGLARLSPEHKTYVFDEVAHRAKSQLFEPPFSDHLDEVLARLAKPPERPNEGSYLHICVSMIVYAPSEEWSRQLLASRGPVLRQRIAEGIASWASGGDYKEDFGRRFFAAAEHLINDDNFKVRISAASTLYGLTRKGNQVLSKDDLEKANAYLDSWERNEPKRNLSPTESDQIKRFKANLQR